MQRLNHVTINSLTLHYTNDAVYLCGVLVYQGEVTMARLTVLAMLLSKQ